MTQDEERSEGKEKTKVFYNGAKFEFEHEIVPGSELYSTFHVPSPNKLFLDVKGHNEPDKFIPNDNTPIPLKNGQQYYDLPPGTVGGWLNVTKT